MAKATPIPAYTAMALQKHGHDTYVIIELVMSDDGHVISITKSDPKPYYMAAHEQKQRGAHLWNPLSL